MELGFEKTDGGRKDAGFEGDALDCVTRAIAIATTIEYREVYDNLFKIAKGFMPVKRRTKRHLDEVVRIRAHPSPRNKVSPLVYSLYLESLHYQETVKKLKLNDVLFQEGTYIVITRGHLATIKDGILYDSFDSRKTTGCFGPVEYRTSTRHWFVSSC
jgi:hypothetical protein